jgi:D-alanine-D-alanine ligase
MSRIRVGILFGGRSAEHEVSLLSARNVLAALDRDRFDPVLIGIDKNGKWLVQREAQLLESARDPRLVKLNSHGPAVALEPRPTGGELTRADGPLKVDVIFPVLHGPMGEDGTVQGLLELADLPYVGAGVLGSALGMDKDLMKRVLRDARIPVTDFRTIRCSEFERDSDAACAVAAEVGFPLFTKPANLGSSVGIRRVRGPHELASALAHPFEFDLKALSEAAAIGREIECSVLGNDEPVASVPGEIVVRHKDGFYSYDAKYMDENGAELVIPAKLEPSQAKAVQDMAIRAYRALDCAGMARVDFFLRKDGTLLVNEINTLPGFTQISMYPKLWEASGLGRHRRKSELKNSYEFSPA